MSAPAGEPTPWGLYVHVPWCRVRCPYCAFDIVVARERPDPEPFVDRVLAEVEARAAAFPGPPDTVYLGGGTPSRLAPGGVARLLAGLPRTARAEVSAEANPEDVTPEWLEAAVEAGLTRLSLGVQTLDAQRARRLGRAHTVRHAREALAFVRSAGLASWSVDVIFAVPGQTLGDLDAELDALLALEPPHVALYGLTFEPGTRFEAARRSGRLQPVDEALWAEMYDLLVGRLGAAGLERYEVSNFARPGHRCRHNAHYWSDRPYLGAGPWAHGYRPDGRRTVNPPLGPWLAGQPPTVEQPTPEQAAIDLLVSTLRSTAGTDLERLHAQTGLRPDPGTVSALRAAGLLVGGEGRLQLTHAGFPVCDAVVARLCDGLQ